MTRLAFDAGALIALERRRQRLKEIVEVEAIVMASAATRGDVVYSSDVEGLERLRRRFPNVRVLRA